MCIKGVLSCIATNTGSMLGRKLSDPIDGPPFVAGCVTLLRQFHSDNTDQCIAYLGQYVRSMVDSQIGAAK